jgi:hypothetical protein
VKVLDLWADGIYNGTMYSNNDKEKTMVTKKQISSRRWQILVDGQVVFTTHRGEKHAVKLLELYKAKCGQ